MSKKDNDLTKIFIKYHENQQGGTHIKNKYRFLSDAHFISTGYLDELEKFDLIKYVKVNITKNEDNTFSLAFYKLDNIDKDTLIGLLRIHGIIS